MNLPICLPPHNWDQLITTDNILNAQSDLRDLIDR